MGHAFEQVERDSIDIAHGAQDVVGAVPEIGVDAILDPGGRFGGSGHGVERARDLFERR